MRSRASWMAAACRAYTSHVTARNATSQTATQWRPLSLTGHLERAEMRRAGARVGANLVGPRPDGSLCQQPAERTPPAGAHRLARWTNATLRPIAERVLDDAVLARMVGDHRDPAARHERCSQRRKRQVELLELLVHHDPQRLEQPRELRRPGARPQRLADRVHEIVARRER